MHSRLWDAGMRWWWGCINKIMCPSLCPSLDPDHGGPQRLDQAWGTRQQQQWPLLWAWGIRGGGHGGDNSNSHHGANGTGSHMPWWRWCKWAKWWWSAWGLRPLPKLLCTLLATHPNSLAYWQTGWVWPVGHMLDTPELDGDEDDGK